MNNPFARRCPMCDEWYDERDADAVRVHGHPEPQSGVFRELHMQSHLPYERWIETLVGKAWLESLESHKEDVRCAVANERKRCRKSEVEPLMRAVDKYVGTGCSSRTKDYLLAERELYRAMAAVNKITEANP